MSARLWSNLCFFRIFFREKATIAYLLTRITYARYESRLEYGPISVSNLQQSPAAESRAVHRHSPQHSFRRLSNAIVGRVARSHEARNTKLTIGISTTKFAFPN